MVCDSKVVPTSLFLKGGLFRWHHEMLLVFAIAAGPLLVCNSMNVRDYFVFLSSLASALRWRSTGVFTRSPSLHANLLTFLSLPGCPPFFFSSLLFLYLFLFLFILSLCLSLVRVASPNTVSWLIAFLTRYCWMQDLYGPPRPLCYRVNLQLKGGPFPPHRREAPFNPQGHHPHWCSRLPKSPQRNHLNGLYRR